MLPPTSRGEFEIAILCALALEHDAVELLFDERWDDDGDRFKKSFNDPNAYSTGRIGKHNVVLALTRLGKVNAATAAASLRSSYWNLSIVLLVGICGGSPRNGDEEILLGDVVLGTPAVLQYDLGKQYPNGFRLRGEKLRNTNSNLCNFVSQFIGCEARKNLHMRTIYFLKQLQSRARSSARYTYPGTMEDKLFKSNYWHKHHRNISYICEECHESENSVCERALSLPCDELGCDETHLQPRERLTARRILEQGASNNEETQNPIIHIGEIASADTVMKSGEDRDVLTKSYGVIAFEMEGAGIIEAVPSIVVKGVCDYADSHKNRNWQDFAAATAAAATKALLERYIATDQSSTTTAQKLQPRQPTSPVDVATNGSRDSAAGKAPLAHFMVPFGRNENFVGREIILEKVIGRVWPGKNTDSCQRTVIEGLGGVGKTQLALETVYRIRERHPECSIFWVPAVDESSFENAYRAAGKQLEISGIDDKEANVKTLVKNALNNKSNGSWVMVIDNADDTELLFDVIKLEDCLPSGHQGSILFTTRFHKVAVELAHTERAILRAEAMDDCEALELLRTGLCESQTSNPDDAQRLLDLLAYLPLAIKQASAYMAKEQVSISTYLEDFEAGQDNILELLNEDFSDPHRYIGVQNPVAKTWLISFQHIAKRSPLAAEYLKFMSFLAAKDIPEFLLPPARTMEIRKAVGTLKGYAFITQLAGQESFDMHRLVRLATQMWLKKNGQLEKYAKSATQRLDEKFPYPIIDNKDMWTKCLPHVQAALEFRVPNTIPESKLSFKVALCLMFLGHCRGAENQARIAVESCERLLGKESPDTILSLHVLEKTLSSQGKFQETERIQRHSVKIRERVEGPGSPNTILSTIFLAETLRHQWKHRAAEELERRTVELSDRFMGPRHPITLLSMRGLATALFHQGKFAEAEKMYREMLMIQELEQGPEHPFTLLGVENLAIALCRQGKYTEAEQMYRKTLKIHEREKGPEHPFTFLSMQGLASALHRQEKFAEAEQMYRKTFEIQKRVQGPDHPHTLSSLRGLAAVLLRLGKVAELEWILSGS